METCDRCGREIPSGAWYIHADGASYCSAGCFHADGWKDSDMDDDSPVCWTLNGDEYPGFEDSFTEKRL